MGLEGKKKKVVVKAEFSSEISCKANKNRVARKLLELCLWLTEQMFAVVYLPLALLHRRRARSPWKNLAQHLDRGIHSIKGRF